MGVGSLRARVAGTVYLNQHHRTLVYQGDGVQDVTITNNSGATVTIYNGARTSTTTTTIADAASGTYTLPYQLWASTGSGPMTVVAGSGLAVDDLTVNDDLVITDDVDMDVITATSATFDGAAGLILSADGGKDTLALSNTTANVGVTIGADTNLYRSAANTLYTDDALSVAGTLAAVAAATVGTTLGVTGVI